MTFGGFNGCTRWNPELENALPSTAEDILEAFDDEDAKELSN